MAKEISRLFVTLGIDSKEFKNELKAIDKDVSKLAKSMVFAGGAVLAGMGAALNAWSKAGDEIYNLHQKTGMSSESLSVWRYGIELSGGSASNLKTAVSGMSGAIVDANAGLKTYQRAFQSLNLDYKTLLAMSPDEQFEKIATAIAGQGSATFRTAAATNIFGRAGMDLLPVLEDGVAGIAKLRKEAHDLGIVFDDEAARKAAEFNETIIKLKKSVQGAVYAIAEQAAPTVNSYAKILTDATKSATKYANENEDLSNVVVNTAMSFAAVVLQMGGVLYVLPKLIQLASATKIKFFSLTGATVGLTIGLTLLGTGISMLVQLHQKFNDQVQTGKDLSEEYRKSLAGEDNQLKETLLTHADALEIYARASGMKEAEKEAYYEWGKAARKAVEDLNRAEEDAQRIIDENIEGIKRYYGDYEESAKTLIDIQEDAHKDRMQELDDELKKVQELRDKNVAAYEDEYRRGIDALKDKYQAEIDAIDEQEETEERARRVREDSEEVAALKGEILSARTATERLKLEEELSRKLQDIIDRDHQWEVQDKKESIREEIKEVNAGINEEAIALAEARDAEIAAEDLKLKDAVTGINTRKTEEEAFHKTKLTQITEERDAFIKAQLEMLVTWKQTHALMVQQPQLFPPEPSSWTDWFSELLNPNAPRWQKDNPKIPSFAGGGIVPGAIGQPVPIMAHGGEVVSQPGRPAVTNTFNISQLVVREEADVQRIARELYRMQQVRI